MKDFKPHHINANPGNLAGNGRLGRYVFLTGCDTRARKISEHFLNSTMLTHPRHHNLYLGQLPSNKGLIDVAAVSSGMGGPSADIIINELILLGARRILRIGTAGSLQPDVVKAGDLVIATAAVRDDKASWDYIYKEYPAVSSIEYLLSAQKAGQLMSNLPRVHRGIVHSKSSLFAREYHYSLLKENEDYMQSLRLAGVLATEMECAQLFILSSLGQSRIFSPVLCGAILSIVGDKTSFCDEVSRIETTIENAILLGIETTRQLYLMET